METELFKTLSSTNTGKQLVDYLKNLQNKICDSRNWKEKETKESSNQAARYIQEIIDKIHLPNPQKINEVNQFE